MSAKNNQKRQSPNDQSSPTPLTAPVDSSTNVGLQTASESQPGAAFGVAPLLGRSSEEIISELVRTDEVLKHAFHSLVCSIEACASHLPTREASQPTIEVSMPASQSMRLNIQLEV